MCSRNDGDRSRFTRSRGTPLLVDSLEVYKYRVEYLKCNLPARLSSLGAFAQLSGRADPPQARPCSPLSGTRNPLLGIPRPGDPYERFVSSKWGCHSSDPPATPVTLLHSHSISQKMLDNNEDPFTAFPSSYDQVSRFQRTLHLLPLTAHHPLCRANAMKRIKCCVAPRVSPATYHIKC